MNRTKPTTFQINDFDSAEGDDGAVRWIRAWGYDRRFGMCTHSIEAEYDSDKDKRIGFRLVRENA